MAFQTAIGAGTFSSLAVSKTAVTSTPANAAAWKGYFATLGDIVEIPSIREMPVIGQRANIVKVPQFGSATSYSIGAQSDAPDLTLTVNYVPAEWDEAADLGLILKNKEPVVFQFALLYSKPASLIATNLGLGTVDNTLVYWVGRMESLELTPSLSDSNTASVAISLLSPFSAFFTV